MESQLNGASPRWHGTARGVDLIGEFLENLRPLVHGAVQCGNVGSHPVGQAAATFRTTSRACDPSSRLARLRIAWYEGVVNGRLFQFEWDEAKASANARKHGVAFELASSIFMIHACLRSPIWSTARQRSGGVR